MVNYSVKVDNVQNNHLVENNEQIKKIIVGGGVVTSQLQEKLQGIQSVVFATYGMTETVSHIAVRNLKKLSDNPNYKCLKGNSIRTNLRNQLIINSENLKLIEIDEGLFKNLKNIEN